jgi:hypothetical protein
LAFWPKAHRRANLIADGMSLLNEALELVERTDERWYEAELYRLMGEMLIIGSDRNDAKLWLCRALETAHTQGAKHWELRAATSLARLWRDQAKRPEARALLAPIYACFTEGFDTRDLKEVAALLAELTANWSNAPHCSILLSQTDRPGLAPFDDQGYLSLWSGFGEPHEAWPRWRLPAQEMSRTASVGDPMTHGGQKGFGMTKHGRSGHATRSPRFRFLQKLEAQKNDRKDRSRIKDPKQSVEELFHPRKPT